MVAIRLTRRGAKKKPSYRVIVTDSRRPRDSKNLEIVGHYNPRPDPIELALKRDRIAYWLGVGARPSDTVKRLIKYFDEKGATKPEAKPTYEPKPVEKTASEIRAEMTPAPVEEAVEEVVEEAVEEAPAENVEAVAEEKTEESKETEEAENTEEVEKAEEASE